VTEEQLEENKSCLDSHVKYIWGLLRTGQESKAEELLAKISQ
jgi:hypothetical protein